MAEAQILPVADLRQHLPRLGESLSKADFDRLTAILPFFKPQQASKALLSACLDAIATGRGPQEQMADFRAFRQRLRQAARKAGLKLTLEVDSKKRSEPQGRLCWFTQHTTDRITKSVEAFSEGVIASLETTTTIQSRAMVSVAPTHVRFFVSYDPERDRTLAKNLLDRLQLNFRVSKDFYYDIWDDTAIMVGEHRAHAIAEALNTADFGLFLVSVAWLGKFEPAGSLSVFVTDDGKPVIPVVLKNVVQEHHQLHGLELRQLFRLESSRGVLKCYAECRPDAERDRFALSLFQQIEQRLRRWMAAQSPSLSQPSRTQLRPSPGTLDEAIDPDARAEELMHAWRSDRRSTAKRIDALARETSLRDTLDVESGNNAQDHSVIALEALQQWALDPHAAPYCAILGEYGIGKTTTLKQFTETLLKLRRDGEDAPLPIFIDLRIYSPTIHKGDVPPLEPLLQELLDRVWETTHRQAFKAEDILRLVREEGAILIFDGLDEKLVHLDETQGRAFLRTLWNALPPFDARPDHSSERSGRRHAPSTVTTNNRRRGRLIFSCRSHYFKTLRDQNAMLRGEYRDGVRAADYRAWVLLPFNEDQIREYLSAVLGPARVDDALTLFARVHNLRELAERPYLLALIADRIGELEARQASGEGVRGVTLYELLVEEWLKRDDGKHHLRPEDKLTLMEEIAAEMWQDGTREWPWRRVLAWLGKRLARDEVFRSRYAKDTPELLEEDFRTATFVLRPDESLESFRFAHTSLQEYFLARYLLQALIDNDSGKWEMPFPSPETLDFLGQLLATSPAREWDRAVRTLEDLLGTYRPSATHIALRYWMVAIDRDLPTPTPLRVDLHGADLSGLEIRGRSPEQLLNLVDANLSETQLIATHFEYVDLSCADLTHAQAERAEFHDVRARDILVTEADMTGAIWRHCDVIGLRGGASADWYECQWIACDLDPATLPDDFGKLGTLSPDSNLGQPVPDGRNSEVTTVFGHSGAVEACGFSPDGNTLVSGSRDSTLKLWEVHSGKCERTLEGHSEWVSACSFSPDGRLLISGSYDHTLKLWEVHSGTCLRTLQGHGGPVLACGFSPDGRLLISGSYDHTLKLWEVHSGTCLRTLQSHSERVSACGFSPDGRTLVSGAWDGTLKLWEVHSGTCLRTLQSHSERTSACGFSPDGRTLVSGAWDGTLKLWDVRSAKCLRTLEGHSSGVMDCGFSSDGRLLVSGSCDHTLKLWEVRSGKCLHTLEGHDGGVSACSFSPDSRLLVSGFLDHTLKLWEVHSGKCLRTLEGDRLSVLACSFSPDGRTLVSGSEDGTLKLWDVCSGQCLNTLERYGRRVSTCSFSPDGRTLVSGSENGTLKLWDVRSAKCLRTLEGHSSGVMDCGFSSDGRLLVSGSCDHTLKLWEACTGKCLRTLKGHSNIIWACGFSPDGRTVVSGSWDGTLKLWEVRTGEYLRTLKGHSDIVWACGFSPDGRTVVSGSYDHTLKLWEVHSGKCLRTLEGHGGSVAACGFSPDGRTLVSGSDDRTLKLWEVRSGKCLRTLEGHGGSVTACGFSPDGCTLTSGSWDGTLKLWEVRTGEMCMTLVNAPHGQTAALDERHNRILAASPDAWRYLGWRYFDPQANRLRILPAEHFGPLPSQ